MDIVTELAIVVLAGFFPVLVKIPAASGVL